MMSMKSMGVLLAVSLAGVAFAGNLSITAPADGATVPLLTDAQKAYLAMPRTERRVKFADKDYCKKEMGLPAKTINESVEKYVLSLGFTSADIATFRGIML